MTREKAIDTLERLKTTHMCDFGWDTTGIETFDLAIKEIKTVDVALCSIDTGIEATGHSDDYTRGFCNGLIWLKACITGEEPKFFEKESEVK